MDTRNGMRYGDVTVESKRCHHVAVKIERGGCCKIQQPLDESMTVEVCVKICHPPSSAPYSPTHLDYYNIHRRPLRICLMVSSISVMPLLG